MKKLISLKNTVISILGLLIIWQLAYSMGGFGDALFPSPIGAWKALVRIAADGTLLKSIGTSMYRFAAGYISGTAAAILIGLVLGWFANAFKYINPVVQLLRPISPTAWMPFIALWFGIGDIPAIVIIIIAAFFPVLLSTVSAVRDMDPIYLKIAKSFGIKQPQLMWKIIFPTAFPRIANGIHLALGTAWIFLVAGEMVGCQSGLGYLIIDSRNNIDAATLLAAIIVIGIIGLILDTLLRTGEKKVLRSWGGIS